MHRTSEYGIAAHWRYKEREGEEGTGDEVDAALTWFRQVLEWQQETPDSHALRRGQGEWAHRFAVAGAHITPVGRQAADLTRVAAGGGRWLRFAEKRIILNNIEVNLLLAADGCSVAVVVVGGAALALRGIVGRGTFDVDVIARAEDRGDGVVLEGVRRR